MPDEALTAKHCFSFLSFFVPFSSCLLYKCHVFLFSQSIWIPAGAKSCGLPSLLAPVSWDFGLSSAVIPFLHLSHRHRFLETAILLSASSWTFFSNSCRSRRILVTSQLLRTFYSHSRRLLETLSLSSCYSIVCVFNGLSHLALYFFSSPVSRLTTLFSPFVNHLRLLSFFALLVTRNMRS